MPGFERNFLHRLAPIWLACRWRVMGHGLTGRGWPPLDLRNDLLGMCDYAAEMRLECKEILSADENRARMEVRD